MSGYNIDDFLTAAYLDEDQFKDGLGLYIDDIEGLHRDRQDFESSGSFEGEFAWFVHLDGKVRFNLYLYAVTSWSHLSEIRSVEPLVLIHGTTFDGPRACWFSNTEPSNLLNIAKGLTCADRELERRGWCL